MWLEEVFNDIFVGLLKRLALFLFIFGSAVMFPVSAWLIHRRSRKSPV